MGDQRREKPNRKIEFHADDYGLFPTQSHRILDCHRNGNLNGISIMPNSPHLTECMSDMYQFSEDVAVSVHLNLFEGNSLCDPRKIPLLTDGEGRLKGSFGKLLLHSFLPGKDAYRQQLKQELRAQIQAVQRYFPEGTSLRLDGHAHYHMIPLVFDAMMDVIREDKLEVSYIRIPKEYLSIYLPHIHKLKDVSPINFVKVLILNFLSLRAEKKYGDILKNMQHKLFMGVFLSGRMYYENLIHLLHGAVTLADRLEMDMEILGHPGGVFEEADIAQITSEEDKAFLTSPLRNRERSMFLID